MTKKWLAAMLGAAALALSAGAMAQQTAIYAGVEAGQADVGNEDDIGLKIFAGARINPNLAAEVGYSQLFDKGGTEVTALEVVAVGSYPLAHNLSLIGKLGFANMEVDVPGRREDELELTYGLGLQFEVTNQLGIRVQWQRYDSDTEVDFLSVGAVFRF
jgi:hypothetical protein